VEMVKFGIVSSYATSLKVVAEDVAYALNNAGHEAVVYTWQIPSFEARKLFEKGIVIIPFDPIYMNSWVLLQRDYIKAGIPSVTYTTVEGKPKEKLIDSWVKRDGVFVANSEYTKKMVEAVGARVIKVIPHGVNLEMARKARKKRKEIKDEVGAEVLFGTIANSQPRKGLDKLAQVASMVKDELKGAFFYVLTAPTAAPQFKGLENVVVDTKFGKLTRLQLFELINNFDFYLCTSHAEGFCLPVLEAEAMGKPVIFPEYAPLTEITHPSANFPVTVTDMTYADLGFGMMFTMHWYDVEEMAEQVRRAYEVYTCNVEEYKNRSKQVRQFAKKFDIKKVYKKFLDI